MISDRQANTSMRAPGLVGYSSTQFDESSSDEEEGLCLERDESWEIYDFDPRYLLHHFVEVSKRYML